MNKNTVLFIYQKKIFLLIILKISTKLNKNLKIGYSCKKNQGKIPALTCIMSTYTRGLKNGKVGCLLPYHSNSNEAQSQKPKLEYNFIRNTFFKKKKKKKKNKRCLWLGVVVVGGGGGGRSCYLWLQVTTNPNWSC